MSQNAVAITPTTAPSVLQAYSAPTVRPSPPHDAIRRSIAGSVAPIAAVAGSSIRKVPPKATVHCQAGAGLTPVQAMSALPSGAISAAIATLHSATSASQPAYQRAGRLLRSMRGPSTSEPMANPPKKAAMTASTATASCPTHSALCWVQAIW